jgi:hypothetical protein
MPPGGLMFYDNKELLLKYIYGLFGVACLCSYIWLLYTRALNIPYHDDILDILGFLLDFTGSQSISEKFNSWVAPHNVHRTLVSRFVYYLVFVLDGEVNFRTLSFVANLALPILILFYCKLLKEKKSTMFFFLIAGLVLFQPRAYGVIFWPMSAFGFFYSLLYSLAALYFLSVPSSRNFSIAILFALAANYTLASGQLVWLIGFFYLLYRCIFSGEYSRSYLVVWVVIAIISVLAYHSGGDERSSFSVLFNFTADSLAHQFRYLLVLLGSGFAFGSVQVSLAIGSLFLFFLIFISCYGFRSQLPVSCFFCWLIVLSCISVAMGRGPISTLEYALMPRYSFASLNLFLAILVTAENYWSFNNLKLQGVLLVVLVIFFCGSYYNYLPDLNQHLEKRKRQYEVGRFWVYGRPGKVTNDLVKQSIERGIYHPPSRAEMSQSTE